MVPVKRKELDGSMLEIERAVKDISDGFSRV
jgi:hypothetical protein